jgi:hypothetical protein
VRNPRRGEFCQRLVNAHPALLIGPCKESCREGLGDGSDIEFTAVGTPLLAVVPKKPIATVSPLFTPTARPMQRELWAASLIQCSSS